MAVLSITAAGTGLTLTVGVLEMDAVLAAQSWMSIDMQQYLETPEAEKKCLRPPRRKITPHEFCFASGGLKTPLESKKRLKHKSLPKP